MSEIPEANFTLHGLTIGDAAARLTHLAGEMNYRAVANGPLKYQLIRRRRRGLKNRTEAMTVTFLDERAGPRVRVIGDIDMLFIEHLTGHPGGQPPENAAAPPAEPGPPPSRLFEAPADQHPLPSANGKAVRPAASSAGMISAVPGAQRAEASAPPAAPLPPPGSPLPIGAGPSPVPAPGLNAAAAHPFVITPDGAAVSLATARVVGRNPDATLGPDGALPLMIQNPSLSKSHCVLHLVDGSLAVVDLNSLNGTVVESGGVKTKCVPGEALLSAMPAVVWVGEVRLDVSDGGG